MRAGDGFGALTLEGYLSADWYHESHHIAKVVKTATETTIQLAEYSRYGVCEAIEPPAGTHCAGKAPGRFKVSHLDLHVSLSLSLSQNLRCTGSFQRLTPPGNFSGTVPPVYSTFIQSRRIRPQGSRFGPDLG